MSGVKTNNVMLEFFTTFVVFPVVGFVIWKLYMRSKVTKDAQKKAQQAEADKAFWGED